MKVGGGGQFFGEIDFDTIQYPHGLSEAEFKCKTKELGGGEFTLKLYYVIVSTVQEL